jgi:chromosome segregation ATPase
VGTESAEKKLHAMKRRLETLKEDVARLQGERTAELRKLKDLGCKDLEEAEKVLAKTKKEAEKLERELEEAIERLEKDFDW